MAAAHFHEVTGMKDLDAIMESALAEYRPRTRPAHRWSAAIIEAARQADISCTRTGARRSVKRGQE